jgi:hypothetical protein
MLDRMSGLLMGPDKLRPCREDHVHLYALFGDPATPIGRPRGEIKVSAPRRARPGQTFTVSCVFDRVYEGEAVATLEARRGASPRPTAPVAGLKGAELLETMERNWGAANGLVLARSEARVEGESLKIGLAFPAEGAPDGEYVVKVFVSDAKGCAIGSAPVALGEGKEGKEGDGEEEGY